MANSDKSMRQDVQGEAAKKLMSGQGHQFFDTDLFVILVAELDLIEGKILNTMIGNSNFVSISSEVFNDLFGPQERSFCINYPCFSKALLIAGVGNGQFSFAQPGYELCPEDLTHSLYREKEFALGRGVFPFSVFG